MNRFLSFADSRMSAALERLGRQAEALDFFDEITLFTEHDFPQNSPAAWAGT